MSVSQTMEELQARWQAYFERARKPGACIFCGGWRLWWNGTRVRSASVLCEGEVHYVAEVCCRRVKCAARECCRGWTLRPPGLTPQRHYQLEVVAEGTTAYLSGPGATLTSVADELHCSRQTVRRFVAWVCAIATVADLMRHLAEQSAAPVVPRLFAVTQARRKARSGLGRAVLAAAAGVLCVLEALAMAAGLPTPGLSGVVEVVVADRYRVTTYADPAIPEFVRSERLWLWPR